MSLDPPTYLSSLQNNIRARPIPWDGAVRAGTISQDQLNKIRAVDKVRKDQRKQTVEADLSAYCSLFAGGDGASSIFESAARKAELVQYIVLSRLLAAAAASSPKGTPATDKASTKLLSYLSILTKSSDGGLQDIAVQEYSALLCGKKSRQLFWEQRTETVAPLVDILRAAAGVSANGDSSSTLWSGAGTIRSGVEGSIGGGIGLQLLYHVLLAMWQLSFEGVTIGEGLEDEYDVIPLYTQLLRLSPKEKTTRLLISTLYNLLSANPKTLLPAAALARLPALLQNLTGRHLSDEDLLEDLKSLTDMLDEHTKTQTTFDEYAAEVNSGHLRWSPPHRNTIFWAENARKILDFEKGELPKKIAEIISKPWDNDKQVLAIACNDIGCLVKEVPEKRQQLEKLGLKSRVMELMAEPDESVRWESLRAVGEWLRYSFETK
ncbi:MAG: H(+)-transporting V1 sector ATPase subunit H [Claussenomyces sp. TS43310]|nr:MAG: H(+)-transporting V1 sector ATPase subunit H [Claussenomyces sp. TS43310]